jgi:hypothetical protein
MELGLAAICIGTMAGIIGFRSVIVSRFVDLWIYMRYIGVSSVDELPHFEEIRSIDDYDDCSAILFFPSHYRAANKDELSILKLLSGPDQEFMNLPTLEQIKNIMEINSLTKVIFNNYLHSEFVFQSDTA